MKYTKAQINSIVTAIRSIKTLLQSQSLADTRYVEAVNVIDSSGVPTILDEAAVESNLNAIGSAGMATWLVKIKKAAEGSVPTPPVTTATATSITVLPVAESISSVIESVADGFMNDEDDEERLLREARAKRKAAEAAAHANAEAIKAQSETIRSLTTQVTEMGKMVNKMIKAAQHSEQEMMSAKSAATMAQAESQALRVELTKKMAPTSVVEVTELDIQNAVDRRLAKALRDTLGITTVVPAESVSGGFELRTLTVPKLDEGYILDESKEKLLNAAWAKAKAYTAENILLTGPTGCGKTSAVEQFCARNGLPMLMMSCQNLREVRDWFGAKTIEGGSMRWQRSQFEMAISAGNCVCVLDEWNRTTPYVSNGLMPLLDHRRSVLIEEIGETIRVGNGVLFVGTINEGGAYTGTHTMDLATRGRFGLRIECDYLPEGQEIDVLIKKTGLKKDQAKRLVQLARSVRVKANSMDGAGLTGSISTRQLITAAEYLANGGTSTLEFTIVNHFDGTGGVTSERAQVVAMLEGKFPELKGGAPETTEVAE